MKIGTIVRVYRSLLALAGFGVLSLTYTFWYHHQLDYDSLGAGRHHPFIHRRGNEVHDPFNRVDEYPIIHIVHTRFMQYQPNLIHLGLARLELLKAFFFQSLQGQTTNNFLVVIRTDPELNDALKEPLLAIFPNNNNNTRHSFRYLVVGTNENPEVNQYANILDQLEHGHEIWSGNIPEVREYLAANASRRMILETRLDSDDGLNAKYLQVLQRQARDALLPKGTSDATTTTSSTTTRSEEHQSNATSTGGSWKMWCSRKYVEWQYMSPWDLKAKRDERRQLQRAQIPKTKKEGDNRKDVQKKEVPTKDDAIEDDDTEITDSTAESSEEEEEEDKGLPTIDSTLGALIASQFGVCLSAGITLAYLDPSEENTSPLPSVHHHESLARAVPHCHKAKDDKPARKTNCLTLVELNPSVLRARTPTSAGMLNIFWDWDAPTHKTVNKHTDDAELDSSPKVQTSTFYQQYQNAAQNQKAYQGKLWIVAKTVFGLTPTRIRTLREYLKANMTAIAMDNLKGQCSTGHSCKNSSQAMLRSILAATE